MKPANPWSIRVDELEAGTATNAILWSEVRA
jgi:hypothetical protein